MKNIISFIHSNKLPVFVIKLIRHIFLIWYNILPMHQMIKHHHISPGNGAVDELAAAQLLGCAAYYG